MAAALARIEARPGDPDTITLLEAAYSSGDGQVIGLTGPPGVGKSTLSARMIEAFRRQGQTVGVIAIDPSSKRTGGALLGDRVRLALDAEDQGIFVRSMAARGRLGGLANATYAAVVLMRAVYDRVIVETVGVGQSETEIATVADTVVLCVQPGSGDSLQYIKAGIAEIPDIAVVGKSDLGDVALRTRADIGAALALEQRTDGWSVPVISVSATKSHGIGELMDQVAGHAHYLSNSGHLSTKRKDQAERWLTDAIAIEFGRHGVAQAGALALAPNEAPFRPLVHLSAKLFQAPGRRKS